MSTTSGGWQDRWQGALMNNYGTPPILLTRGKGSRVWDADNREYVDMMAGIAVSALGHADPRLVAAVSNQLSTLGHTSNLAATEPPIALAEKLLAILGVPDARVFFCNSGAEANEAALKLSRKFGGRGRHAVVSAYGSFHGRTLATLAATGQPAKHEPFFPMPDGFRHVAYGDLGALEAAIDPTVGGVILETVQGEGGVVPAEADYLRGIRQLCDERGMLMIVDEVQTGFGRTGEWFGFQHAGVSPDVVTMAKALGNGFPVGATWARTEVAAAFRPGDHGSTYSGTAIATAVVSAVLAEMRRLDAPSLAAERGATLRAGLEALPGVESVRGQGLLLAAELGGGRDAKDVYTRLLAAGLVTNAVTPTALRFAPPLTVSAAEIAEALDMMRAVLS